MAYLNKTHPMSKLALEILAVNHCIALHDVWTNPKQDFFFVAFEKGCSQYKLVLEKFDSHTEIGLYQYKDNQQIMPNKKYQQPKDLKKIAYEILNSIL